MENEMLLREILDNQHKHGDKLDGLNTALENVKDCVRETETRILGKVSAEFVSKKEFPQMCKTQIKERRTEGMDDFNQTTTFATNIGKWMGWIVAIALAVGLPISQAIAK